MSECLRTALIASPSAHLGLSKSRLETLSTFPIGLIHGRTVNLTHIASHGHGPAGYASKYRRLQYLFMALADGSERSIETLLRTKRARHTIYTLDLFLPASRLPVRLAAKRIKSGEWLLVMTNGPEPRRALQTSRRRWAVECLFGDAKTRGLNLEDTHLTDPRKIDTLTGVLGLAMTWVYT